MMKENLREKNIQKNFVQNVICILFGTIFDLLYTINLIFITMSKGTVKFFNDAKGFGFIVEEGNNKEHFVHISGLIDEIREGDDVEFDLTEGKKGLNAVNVKVI